MSLWQAAAALDRRISRRLRIRDGQRGLRLAALVVAHLGDSSLWAAILVAWYAWGGASLRALAVRTAAAVLTVGILGGIVKRIVRRPRPDGYAPGLYSRTMDRYSFPSGHAARVAAVAVVVSVAYPDFAVAGAACAVAVAVARVALGVHYAGDALGGLLLGTLVAAAWVAGAHGLPL
ncbi:MAG: phosphatase PAP2 family protein [Anaerolineae bacterium]|nr:phosphatase PAP2 family protein [Anaerolineae bacterium]